MDRIKLGEPFEETIAPAYEVLGYAQDSFNSTVQSCICDITRIMTKPNEFYSAGIIKEINKLDYPDDIKLWCLMKIYEMSL